MRLCVITIKFFILYNVLKYNDVYLTLNKNQLILYKLFKCGIKVYRVCFAFMCMNV